MANTYKNTDYSHGFDYYEYQNPTKKNTVKNLIDKIYQFGTSANRPTSGVANTGETYFDTDFSVPVWWNGTAWQNSLGVTSAVN